MGGLWSSCRVKRERGEGTREQNENEKRLIVRKGSHSIVSGEPPAALADVVPMTRSRVPILSTSTAPPLTLGGIVNARLIWIASTRHGITIAIKTNSILELKAPVMANLAAKQSIKYDIWLRM